MRPSTCNNLSQLCFKLRYSHFSLYASYSIYLFIRVIQFIAFITISGFGKLLKTAVSKLTLLYVTLERSLISFFFRISQTFLIYYFFISRAIYLYIIIRRNIYCM